MEDDIFEELRRILEESINSSIERERTTFDNIIAKYNPEGIILFGAGGLGQRTLSGLRKLEQLPLCFSDSNPERWGTRIEEFEILSPQEAVKTYPRALFIVTIWSDQIGHPLDEIQNTLNAISGVGVIPFGFLYWKYPEIFLPYYSIHLPHRTLEQAKEILQAYFFWEDDFSKREYVNQIKWRLTFNHRILSKPFGKQYFPEDIIKLRQNETFIDIGAFSGDTLQYFLSMQKLNFKKYYAFEPDPVNFQKMHSFINDLGPEYQRKIIPVQKAVSHSAEMVKFNSEGTSKSSVNTNGNIEVQAISLDSYLVREKPTYITMDAEGFEPFIIEGAKELIKAYSPVLAVSAYHAFSHLWEIPGRIHLLSKNYKFFLRPHCEACWDLVCYAVPKTGRAD